MRLDQNILFDESVCGNTMLRTGGWMIWESHGGNLVFGSLSFM